MDRDARDVPLLQAASDMRPKRPAARAALISAIGAASLLPLTFGASLGYTSPALAGLERELGLGPALSSAFAALVNVGAMLAAVGGGHVTDALGRRRAIALWALLGAGGWLAIGAGAARSRAGLAALLAGRVLTGCAAGGSSVSVNVYIAEVAPPELRGALAASFQVSVTLGILLVYSAGVALSWRPLALLSASPCALLLLLLPLVPETPRWLLLVKRDAPAARAAMLRLRRPAGGAGGGAQAEAEERAEVERSVDEELAVLAAAHDDGEAAGGGADEVGSCRGIGEATGHAPPSLRARRGSSDGGPAERSAAEGGGAEEGEQRSVGPADEGAEAAAGEAAGARAEREGGAGAPAPAAERARAGGQGAEEEGARPQRSEDGEQDPSPRPLAAPPRQVEQPQRPQQPATGGQRRPARRAPPRIEGWVVRPLLLSIGLMLLQQGSGINAVIFYAEAILSDAGYVAFAPRAALLVAGAQFAITLASVPCMDGLGRRPLLLLAATGMCASQACIAAFFLAGGTAHGLALGGLCGVVGSFSLGLGAIPWALMGELLPQRARGLASSAATLANWSASLLVTLSFGGLVAALGEGWLFALYAGVCGGAVLFVGALVPETKGRSLEQIEAAFRSAGLPRDHPAYPARAAG